MKMNAYEFTRFEADFTAREVSKKYDLGTIEFMIHYNNPGKDFSQDPEYIDAYNTFMELTMSCTYNEAIKWAHYWIVNAIAYGNQTKNKDWMQKFLAANDLYVYLLSQRSVGSRWAN